tara:strand:- start:906 stop:1766 length:861 start_codon:yes stop_codon:yes gene_type:complete
MTKKTKGALIFARNNAQIDYIKQAHYSAKRIRKYLDIPTSIVTDSVKYLKETYKDYEEVFDQIIEVPFTNNSTTKRYFDGSGVAKHLQFKNDMRTKSYELTPYDETILLDSDYIIANSLFKNCFEQDHNFLIFKNAKDLTAWRDTAEFQKISDTSIDFYWATVIFFRKSEENKVFFELTQHIQENWSHYNSIFQVNRGLFRNDHLFSIAIHIMNGYQEGDFAHKLPGTKYYTADRDILWELDEDNFLFLLEKENHLGEYTPLRIKGSNIHVMNKFSLNRIIDGGVL